MFWFGTICKIMLNEIQLWRVVGSNLLRMVFVFFFCFFPPSMFWLHQQAMVECDRSKYLIVLIAALATIKLASKPGFWVWFQWSATSNVSDFSTYRKNWHIVNLEVFDGGWNSEQFQNYIKISRNSRITWEPLLLAHLRTDSVLRLSYYVLFIDYLECEHRQTFLLSKPTDLFLQS